ncbi:MAG: clostripain-related cysteine peptidase, partial [Campylobacterales bacterium]|nr:clostripain-related cysteine peptidase [Campylobacterales bacterium]
NAIGIEFDIIGMDACLMGNLEVAKSVRNYGNYLIASEELEPGHGWDYKDLISWIGKNSAESLENFGKKFVDSFLDSQSHSATKDKTLSVIDLTKIESFMSSFNKLFNSLDGDSDFNYILSASKDSQKYAVDEKNNMADGRTLDLKTFLQNIKSNRSDLSSQIDELNSKIDDFVVYNRYQESKVNSNGISIFQPLNTPYWSTLYKNNEDFVSTEWFSFVGDFLTKGLDDTQDPVISSETSCTNNSKDGYCLDVSDNIGIKSAMDYNLLVYGDKYLILGANKLEKTEDNKYFQPKTDDIWLYFCDGDNYSKCIIPSAFYLQDYDNKYLYYSYGEVNSKLSQFFIEIDNTAGEISHWSVEIGDNNVSSKQQHTIEKGDTLKFYYYVVDSDGNGDWTAGDEIDFINDPNTVISNLGATVYYYSFFTDFKGNGVSGTIHNTSE